MTTHDADQGDVLDERDEAERAEDLREDASDDTVVAEPERDAGFDETEDAEQAEELEYADESDLEEAHDAAVETPATEDFGVDSEGEEEAEQDTVTEEEVEPEEPEEPELVVDAEAYRQRWSAIQAGFVDEPLRAVQGAEGLVIEAWEAIARTFAEETDRISAHWHDEEPSTEDLRIAFMEYRALYARLTAT